MDYSRDQMQTLIDEENNSRDIVLLAQRLPLEAFMIVLETMGGPRGCQGIYIPSVENFFDAIYREQRDAEIAGRYDGKNTAQLSLEYNISQRRIRQIVAKTMEV